MVVGARKNKTYLQGFSLTKLYNNDKKNDESNDWGSHSISTQIYIKFCYK